MKSKLIIIIVLFIIIISTIFGITIEYYNTTVNALNKELNRVQIKLKLEELKNKQKEVNYMYGEATAYTPSEGGINADNNPEVTATMKSAEEGVIATNPEDIPYGSEILIIDGDTVIRGQAQDTGAAMRNDDNHHVDILMECGDEAREFGRRKVHILWW